MTTALANIEKQLADEAQNIKDTLASTGVYIQTEGKLFTTPDGASDPGPIRVIILDYIHYNAYYEKAFDRKNIQAPLCYALTKLPRDLAPMEDSPAPQAESCAECPWDKFGTAVNGKGKACKNSVRLAVVPDDFNAKTPVMLLSVSPTALSRFNTYVNNVAAKFGGPPIKVSTAIAFDPNNTYPTLVFGSPEPHNKLSEAMALRAKASEILNRRPNFD